MKEIMDKQSLFYLIISSLLIIGIIIYVLALKNKKQIHYMFLLFMGSLVLWNCGLLIEEQSISFFNKSSSLALFITYIGLCFLPVFLLITGLVFSDTMPKSNHYLYILFFIPLVTLILIVSNKYHNLFYTKYYSLLSTNNEYGIYFYIHTVFSYLCIVAGLYILTYYSIKNSGFFSKQSILIIIGSIVPLIVNALYTFQIFDFGPVSTPISFSFTIICFAIGIFRYNFLSLTPIALQTIVDQISDAYLIFDENLTIMDYNKAIITNFGNLVTIKRKSSIMHVLDSNKNLNVNANELTKILDLVRYKGETFVIEKNIVLDDYNRFFTIEISPIHSTKTVVAFVMLFKDITEHKKNIEAIKEQQAILIEQERLASLGQLIGGIAHNLKTPIMSISGGIEALKDLAYEYRDSIGDRSVTDQDHKEIAKEMLTWLEKMRPYCAYMSDVISAVKGQAVQMISTSTGKFTVDEVLKRVELLLKHELKRYHCVLNINSHIDATTELQGEVNNLVQVFDNIIINAMQAYDGENGTIDLLIVRSGDNVEFTFKDYGKGIPKNVADRLFKEMITTKGKNGTGLGLYMSYSTIKGRFGGNMSFVTKEGCGTTFFISIPCITYGGQEDYK